jgi:hypothetical protein
MHRYLLQCQAHQDGEAGCVLQCSYCMTKGVFQTVLAAFGTTMHALYAAGTFFRETYHSSSPVRVGPGGLLYFMRSAVHSVTDSIDDSSQKFRSAIHLAVGLVRGYQSGCTSGTLHVCLNAYATSSRGSR